MHTLYLRPRAASMLVHWLLIELDVPHAPSLVDLDSNAQKRPDYLALNPSGVVPTLVIDGKPHFEAAALAMSLADAHPAAGLAPAFDSPQRIDYTQWMFHLANAVRPLLRQWWYPYEPAGAYLLAESLSSADFYQTTLMRWSRNMPKPATEWPHLAALGAADEGTAVVSDPVCPRRLDRVVLGGR